MSDYRRPVDELPVKNESTLSLTDTLIGVDAVAEPAAFQAQLGEIAARLVGPIADDLPSDAGFIDALIASIISDPLLLNQLMRTSVSLRVNNVGVVANIPGRLEITSTKGATGVYQLHAPPGWVWHSAVGGGGSSAARFVAVENSGGQTITVHVFSAANNPIDAQFLIQGTLEPA